jgi:hypothetical protein
MDPGTARLTCRRFRRKTDYYDNEPVDRPEHEVCPEYPWCETTSKDIGPDGGAVHGETCRPGRGCFVPVIPPEA